MSSPPDDDRQEEFLTTIEEKTRRRQRARRESGNLWFGLGTFGMVGWSVAIPTILGILLGGWLDANLEVAFSWTLTLLFAGVVLGCLNAWYWVNKEQRHVQEERERYEHEHD